MSEINYVSAGHAVRDDIVQSQRQAWCRIGSAGNWWTATERLAIAAEARNAANCRLCRVQKEALSPNQVSGDHADLGDLPAHVVAAIHRIQTDPGRLTRDWYEGILAAGSSAEEYVEMVGVIVTTVVVDTFSRGIGVARPSLPKASDGTPSKYRPSGAKQHDHWVPTLMPEDITATDLFVNSSGRGANIYMAMSLVPQEVLGFFDLGASHYLSGSQKVNLDSDPRTIDRAQIELLAARVSAINQCVY